jgi:hypothetical protein
MLSALSPCIRPILDCSRSHTHTLTRATAVDYVTGVLSWLNDNWKGLVGFVVGGIVVQILLLLRRGVQTLTYTVTHERIGVSADDAALGDVRVTFRGNPLKNIFLTNIRLENSTNRDLKDLQLILYASRSTYLLTETTKIVNRAYSFHQTLAYQHLVALPEGGAPTKEQEDIYYHGRDYLIPLLNRGEQAIVTLLTTANEQPETPLVWADVQHEGVRVAELENVRRVFGMPQKWAVIVGIVACVFILAALILLIDQVWLAAIIAMICGLMAQMIAVGFYRGYLLAKRVIMG